MTLVFTIKSNIPTVGRGNARTRRNARRATERATKLSDLVLARKIDEAASNSLERAVRASAMPTLKTAETASSCCLPEVAMYRVW